MKYVKAILFVMLGSQLLVAGHLTREALQLAMKQCATEFIEDLNTQFESMAPAQYEGRASGISIESDDKYMWVSAMTMNKSVYRNGSRYSETLTTSRRRETCRQLISWDHKINKLSFQMPVLPFVSFTVKEKITDKFGSYRPERDRLEISKIVDEKEDAQNFLVNAETSLPTPIKADQEIYVQCLQQLLEIHK